MDADYELVTAKDVFPCLSDAERAAVGWVSATVGSQCTWTSEEHMSCRLTSALALGDQCEDAHWAFLRKWLKGRMPARCWRIPIGAYSQAVINELTLSTVPPRITVAFSATGTTGPAGKAWTWSETLVFEEREPESLELVRHDVKGKPF
jgi:hypothetical protein